MLLCVPYISTWYMNSNPDQADAFTAIRTCDKRSSKVVFPGFLARGMVCLGERRPISDTAAAINQGDWPKKHNISAEERGKPGK